MLRPGASSALVPLARASALSSVLAAALSSLCAALSLAALGAASLGCGDGEGGAASGGDLGGPPTLTIVDGPPSAAASAPLIEPHAIDGYASAIASNGSLVAVGTSTSVYEVGAAGPSLLEIVGDEPNLPPMTGAVRAMAPFDSGVLVVAESALFFSAGGALQLSAGSDALHPLGIDVMNARIADDDGDGADETHLAIASKSGAFELGLGSMTAWTVDGEAGEPTAMFSQKDRLFLAFGRRIYEVDKATGKAYPLTFDVGFVSEIACGSAACDDGSLLYFASDQGLVERAADGRYSLYPLSAEGEPPVPVHGFALDLGKQRLYALAGASVVRVRSGERPDEVASIGEASARRIAAVDKLGDVWVAEGLTLRRLAVGTPLSFATDVRPIMHEYCADCHAAAQKGAPKLDFESYDVVVGLIKVVLTRVTERTMPPAAYSKKLPKEKSQILQDWAVTMAP